MRYASKLAAYAALAAPCVLAASIADLPSCALKAASSGIADTGCSTTDYHCLCSATSFTAALQSQVSVQCSPADYQATVTFAQGVCGSVGITLNIPSANNNNLASQPAAAAAAPASGQAGTAAAATTSSGSADSDDDESTAPASSNGATTPSTSYASGAAPTSTSSAAVSASPLTNLPSFTASESETTTTPVAQSFTITHMSTTDELPSSTQITTTTKCTNATSNTTVATSAPVPFEGKAASQRVQWASAALMVGALGAFVVL